MCPTSQTGIAHRSDRLDQSQSKSSPLTGFQRYLPDMSGLRPEKSGQQYDRWNLSSIRSPGPNPKLPIQIVSFRECPEPIWGHPTSLTGLVDQSDRSGLTSPTNSSPYSYKRHSTPSLVGCWLLTTCITFQQPLKLSLSSLCEIQVLGERFLSWV
jgi:hypothetical protein